MPKSEIIFDVARYIGNNAGVRIGELCAVFSGLSERGMFRYLKTLIQAGVVTRYKSRYTARDYWASLLDNVDRGGAFQALLRAGIEACEDEEVVEKTTEWTR